MWGGPDVSNVTVTESDVLAPKVFVNSEGVEKVGTIPTQEAQIIVPNTADIILSSGLYLGGSQTIRGDINLIADNIKKGVSIFNVVGTYAEKSFAFITVTYPSGSTLTCTDGTTTLTADTTTGEYVFCVPYAATWTVTATDGTNTASKNATISTKTQSVSVELTYEFIAFANGAYKDIGSMSNASVTSGAVVITATSSNDTDKVVWSSSNIAVNVTKYKTLRFNARWENNDLTNAVYRYAGVGLTASKMSNGTNIYTPSSNCVAYKQFGGLESGQTVGYATYDINISSISGNYYISAYTTACNKNTILRLKDIRLIP